MLNHFGTHYVSEVTTGGICTMKFIAETCTVKHMSDYNLERAINTALSVTPFEWNRASGQSEEIQRIKENFINIFGASEIKYFCYPPDNSDNPVVIDLIIKPISNLISSDKKEEMDQAITKYFEDRQYDEAVDVKVDCGDTIDEEVEEEDIQSGANTISPSMTIFIIFGIVGYSYILI